MGEEEYDVLGIGDHDFGDDLSGCGERVWGFCGGEGCWGDWEWDGYFYYADLAVGVCEAREEGVCDYSFGGVDCFWYYGCCKLLPISFEIGKCW